MAGSTGHGNTLFGNTSIELVHYLHGQQTSEFAWLSKLTWEVLEIRNMLNFWILLGAWWKIKSF